MVVPGTGNGGVSAVSGTDRDCRGPRRNSRRFRVAAGGLVSGPDMSNLVCGLYRPSVVIGGLRSCLGYACSHRSPLFCKDTNKPSAKAIFICILPRRRSQRYKKVRTIVRFARRNYLFAPVFYKNSKRQAVCQTWLSLSDSYLKNKDSESREKTGIVPVFRGAAYLTEAMSKI